MKPRWQQLAGDYEAATGVPCRIVDLNSNTPEACPVCADFHNHCRRKTNCSQVHLFSAYQAERWGGRYIYLCPLSTLHWSSPLMTDGMMSAVVIAGPALLNGIDDMTIDMAGEKYGLNETDRDRLRDAYTGIVSLSPERVKSLSGVLCAMAMAGSDPGDIAVFDEQDSLRRESRIGEYIHFLKSMEGDKNSDMEYPIDLEKQLLSYVSRGEKTKAQDVLNRLMARVMYATGIDLQVIKSRIFELVVLLSRAALEGGADVEKIFGLNYRYLQSIRHCETTEELTAWLRRVIDRFCSLVFDLSRVKHTDTILRALRFLRENFYERLSLGDVADHVNLSHDYFGKLFRSEIGCPFTEYLNRLRIEEAKRLLRSGSASLGDIAYACGFEDQSYFTRVFRKITGTTPSTYREGANIWNREASFH